MTDDQREKAQEACRTIVEHELLSNNFYIFGWRHVPVKAKVLGIKANDTISGNQY